jgi:glycosyltransferase involved in cell wall biosynthesis
MKILIVEEALQNQHGHWFQYIGDICNGGRDAGHDIQVAVHRDACSEIRSTFNCHPILRENVFGNESRGGGLVGFVRMLRRNVGLFQELRAHFNNGHHYDAVIATTPRIDHLYAYLLLNLLWSGKAYRQLVLIFVESVGVYSPDYSTLSFKKKSLPLRWGLQLAKLLPGANRISLATESEGLARQFRAFCGADFTLLPHVTQWVETTSPRSPSVGRLVLGTFGFTRYDKGLDVLQAAIRKLVGEGLPKGCHFVIQWTGDYALPDGTIVTLDQNLEDLDEIEYLTAFKQLEEYPEWLARTDIMVLPYRRNFYYDKLSRVAIDAAQAGQPIVFPKGTWLESFVAEYGAGVAFEPDDADSLAQALRTVVSDFVALREQATKRAVSARESFSAKRFFEIVENLPGINL